MKLQQLILSILFITLVSMKGDVTEINFFDGEYTEALKHAKEMHKPLLIDFYADWCTPCKQMEKYGFKDPEVASHVNNNFVSVRVNVEFFSGMDIADKYHIKTYPTLIILDKRGREKARVTGYQSPKDLLKFVLPHHK